MRVKELYELRHQEGFTDAEIAECIAAESRNTFKPKPSDFEGYFRDMDRQLADLPMPEALPRRKAAARG